MQSLFIVFLITFGLSFGAFLGYFARRTIAKKQADSIEVKLSKAISHAKEKSQDIILKAEEEAVKISEKAKEEEKEQRNQLIVSQRRLEFREEKLEEKSAQLESTEAKLRKNISKVEAIKQEINKIKQKQIEKIEKIAKISCSQAKKLLFKKIEQEEQEALFGRIRKLEQNAQEDLNRKAKEIIALAMQRFVSDQAIELTTSTVALPSDELKGRIIGKEGRNIRALEQLTGVEIIVDDTPGAVVISGFNPVRRQIAKIALEKLILDGRIHPARIEEAVESSKEEINQKMIQAGQAAVYEIGISGFDPKLIQLIGRLMFRTSYGQNVLIHSIEVAHLAGAIASELGVDIGLAKKAGLLHDIGKAIDREIEGTHVEIGKKILSKFGVSDTVIAAMQSHHEEYPFDTLESIIVYVADSISGSRPGARKDTLENYLKRLEELENLATSFKSVEKAYAIQAGREIRIFVSADKIDDLGSFNLAKQIASRIEKELKYPGEIKVNVIRETRAIEYAR